MTGSSGAPHDPRTRELEVFAESSWLVASTLDLGEVLERLADVAQTRLSVDIVRIWLLDARADLLTLRAETGTSGRPVEFRQTLSVGEGIAGRVFESQEPLVVTDVMQDPRVRNRTWFEAEGVRSVMAVPILLDTSPIGIIACMTRTRREFAPDEVKLAAAVAAPAATAVRNAGLYAEALQRLDEIQAFQRVTSETLSSPDLETALRTVLRETRHLLRADGAFCSFVDSASRDVETVVTLGARSAEFPRFRITAGGGMSDLILAERRAVRTDAYLADARFLRAPHLEEWARAEEAQAMIGAPIFDRDGHVIALLWAYNRGATVFTTGDEGVISGLAQQAALAIGTARGMEGERHRARETAALLEIAQVCASTFELRPLLRAVARQVAHALGAERCTINLWRGDVLAPVMAQFADGHVDTALWERFKEMGKGGMQAIPADLGAVRTRRPVVVEDMSTSDLVTPEWVEAFGIRTIIVVPLISGDRVIGTLSLDDTRGPRAWTAADQDLATTMAAQVALAVDRARQYGEAAQRASEVQTLSAVGETLASTLDLQEVLDAIADSATKVTGAQRAVVFEMDQAAGHLLARAVRGMPVDKGYVVYLGQGAAGSAVAQRAPVWSADVVAEPPPGYDSVQAQEGVTLAAMATRFGYRAVLAVPVVSRETALGAVCIYWDEVHRADEREIRLLSALARQAAIAMDNARLVSDLRRTLDDLKAAQDTLVRGATLRAVGELAAGASHHLNNLMAVVLGRTQLLLMKKPPEELVASLKTIERAAVDAAETVRRIQAFGRTDTSDAALAFDLDATVREGIQLTRPRWEHEAQVRGARVDVIYEPVVLPRVPGRAAEIREVVTSLLLNAVDAMPSGGRIVVRTQADKGRSIVSVSDSGSGMSAEVKRRAFEPFFTTKGVKSTGLGLAVAYGTIRRHGGEISLESTEGIGTTVTFWLPAVQTPVAALAAPLEPRPERKGKILVIDDEVSVLDIVAEVLSARGHAVTVAPGGREGLLSFSSGGYDLVMTDLGMPDMNGWDVLRAVKESRPATPVLVLTGWGDTAAAPSGARPDGVLTKPFHLKRLATAVSEALARRA
jgi:GAF domain-containing protein/anti-sigma regulatory factor (Ser/Thr protein kinase)